MISAARIRECEVFGLLQDLGYPVEPVPIVASEWRGAGIEIEWDDSATLHLATRTETLDCYVLDAMPAHDAALHFLRSLQAYNVLRKPVLIASGGDRLAVYDLSQHRELRRLDIDLHNPSPHAIDRLNLLAASGDADHARLFDRALDRETLTRQFFERFRSAVHQLDALLRTQSTKESSDATSAQALLILSRLLFLYFIQHKGWLNGERRFLVDRLEAALQSGHNFYESVLAPLFFGCLNTPIRDRHLPSRLLGNIPYLNGGLFEPSPFESRHANLNLPNDLMQGVIENVFERFAFSIDEVDSGGSHIDPEMLGKVFESLMAEDERAASGSFYTPKVIVDALTERAIAEWCGDDVQRLESITILDPACGSGAFLLSALHTIERMLKNQVDRQTIVERSLFGVDLKPEAVRLCELRLWLAIVSKRDVPIEDIPPLPNLDRNILQGNSLLSPTDFLGDGRGDVYREWMTALRAQSDLIARYRSAPQKDRPALARMMRANDQRMAAELLNKSIEIDERELQQVATPQRDLFGRVRPTNLARCRELHARIGESRQLLDRAEDGQLDFFSYDIHFAHVMARGGFDVVIGNPPWVRNSRIDVRAKRMYADRYRLFRAAGRNAAFHQPDLSIVFFERALALASPAGTVSLLMPAKMMNAAYAAPLRRAAESMDIVALDDWTDRARRLFDADTFPLGITIAKRRSRRTVRVNANGEEYAIPQQALSVAGSEWSLLPPDLLEMVARIYRDNPPLLETLGRRPVMGVKSGDNGSFFLDVAKINGDSVETRDGLRVPLRYVARCVRGRDVTPCRINGASWMLWPPRGGWDRIPRWLERLAKARGIDPDDLQLAYLRPEHMGLKVVWKDVSRGICAAVLGEHEMVSGHRVPLVPNQTLYALEATSRDEASAIVSALNSTIVNALAVMTAERAKDFHYRYFGRTIARIPLPVNALSTPIAKAYGVTVAEEARLSEFLARRLGKTIDD
ncbi:MAG TPA: N-6 DNA methylase [Thermoanaerobaculia bacterium]|nr:N-6 DNA methylase [Thermoanaerobaculia bacterium]